MNPYPQLPTRQRAAFAFAAFTASAVLLGAVLSLFDQQVAQPQMAARDQESAWLAALTRQPATPPPALRDCVGSRDGALPAC